MEDIFEEYTSRFPSDIPRTQSSIQAKYKELKDNLKRKMDKDDSLINNLLEMEKNFKKIIDMMIPVVTILEGEEALLFPSIRVGFRQYKAIKESKIQTIVLKQIFEPSGKIEPDTEPPHMPLPEINLTVEFPTIVDQFTDPITKTLENQGFRGLLFCKNTINNNDDII